MPLTEDQNGVNTAGAIVNAFKGAFGTPPGYRPAHSNGRLTRGVFKPTFEAAALSTAPHFNEPSTPVTVRFSSATGIPDIPDTSPDATPRGMAIRFVLSDDGHKHTDIITHSSVFFPMRTGEGFLRMLGAIGSGTMEKFLAENPSAAAFVQDPKPPPCSFGTEKFYGINAFKLIDQKGKGTFVRYRIVPTVGHSVLSEIQLRTKSSTYLYDELENHLAKKPIIFKILAQVAEEGDPTDDATKHWPESREQVELGTIVIDSVVPRVESKKEQQKLIFDPIPRVKGVEASDDPLLEMRANVYLISGRERREAPLTA